MLIRRGIKQKEEWLKKVGDATEYLKSYGVPDDPANHTLPLHKTRSEVDTELEERLNASREEGEELRERNRALEAERDQLRQKNRDAEAEHIRLQERNRTLEIDISSARKRCEIDY